MAVSIVSLCSLVAVLLWYLLSCRAMDVNGIVAPQTYGDGTKGLPRLDRTGSLVVVEGGGKWQELTRLGLMYTGATATGGVVVPIGTSTTQQFVLYNPIANTKVAVLKAAYAGYNAGTPVIGCLQYIVSNQNAASFTAPTGTANTPINNKTFQAAGSSMSLLTAATVVAGTLFRPAFISVYTTTAANGPFALKEDIDGAIVVMPGSWIAIAANVAAFGTHNLAVEWGELPQSLFA